jgi:hypothetical protein
MDPDLKVSADPVPDWNPDPEKQILSLNPDPYSATG